MTVGDEDCPNPVGAFNQIGNVRDDEVDPKHPFFGELNPTVDDNDIIAQLQGHHVFTDFPQPPKGDDTKFGRQVFDRS
jgi:hypothetical protein